MSNTPYDDDLWAGWEDTTEPAPHDYGASARAETLPLTTSRHRAGVRPHTDLGNAERLLDTYGTQLRYVGVRRRWLYWDGRRWATDDRNVVTHYAKLTVRTIADEPSADGAASTKWAKTSEGSVRIAAMVKLASSDPAVAISPDQLDKNEWMFTCANGTIDLRTGELLPHDPANLCTKMSPVKYDPAATCPTWLAFLDSVFEGNRELIRFIQKAAGYSATASTREQAMFVLTGVGSNGKSTLLEILRAAFGDFSQQLPPETLMERGPDGGPSNDVARLRGARFVGAVETSENRKLAESRVKQLTGGDTVVARFLHAEFEEFKPVAKMWLATNHRPKVSGTDEGIWRRLRLVPFNKQFTDKEKDSTLPDKLQAELPGILAWVIQGTQLWLREGLGSADVIKAATAEYREEQDTIGQFLDEETVSHPNIKVSAAALYGAYQQWALSNGEYVQSQRMLGMKLTDRGIKRDKSGPERRYHWFGVGLKADTRTGPDPF